MPHKNINYSITKRLKTLVQQRKISHTVFGFFCYRECEPLKHFSNSSVETLSFIPCRYILSSETNVFMKNSSSFRTKKCFLQIDHAFEFIRLKVMQLSIHTLNQQELQLSNLYQLSYQENGNATKATTFFSSSLTTQRLTERKMTEVQTILQLLSILTLHQ